MKYGLQLYSVRDITKDDFEGALKKVAEMGTHDELLAKEGIYYNLVMAQRQTTKMAGANDKK